MLSSIFSFYFKVLADDKYGLHFIYINENNNKNVKKKKTCIICVI